MSKPHFYKRGQKFKVVEMPGGHDDNAECIPSVWLTLQEEETSYGCTLLAENLSLSEARRLALQRLGDIKKSVQNQIYKIYGKVE